MFISINTVVKLGIGRGFTTGCSGWNKTFYYRVYWMEQNILLHGVLDRTKHFTTGYTGWNTTFYYRVYSKKNKHSNHIETYKGESST